MSATSQNTGFGTKPYRSYVLGMMLLAYVFALLDRSIINILTEPIKQSFGVEDFHMGLLGGPVFAIFYTFLGIPIARLAERHNRVWIIAISIILWSLMTALCGLSASFLMLIVFRLSVGIGEAGCTPPAQSILCDYFVPSKRATAASIYSLGIPFGIILASLFGGQIASTLTGDDIARFLTGVGFTSLASGYDWSSVEGWRLAFIILGLPGALAGLLIWFTVKEPPRGYTDPPDSVKTDTVSFMGTLKALRSKPSFWHVAAGSTLASFVAYGVLQFNTSFFIRTHALSLQAASLIFGLTIGVMIAIGIFSAGFFVDRVRQKFPTAITWLPALGLILAAPLYILGFLAPDIYLALPPLMLATILHYFYFGPMYTISTGVVDSRMRATAVAIMLFLINFIGYGLGPLVIGALSTWMKSVFLSMSDAGLTLSACKALPDSASSELLTTCQSADANGLKYSLILFSLGYIWAGLHFLRAGKTLKSDMVAD